MSVRIEQPAFSDARIAALGEIAGYNAYEALGRMAHLWNLCTQRCVYVVSDVLIRSCLGRNGVDAIIGAELGERTEGGIRVKGTSGRIEWLSDMREGREAGGKARAAGAERDERGRFKPKAESVKSAIAPSAVQQTQEEPAPSSPPDPALDHGLDPEDQVDGRSLSATPPRVIRTEAELGSALGEKLGKPLRTKLARAPLTLPLPAAWVPEALAEARDYKLQNPTVKATAVAVAVGVLINWRKDNRPWPGSQHELVEQAARAARKPAQRVEPPEEEMACTEEEIALAKAAMQRQFGVRPSSSEEPRSATG